MEEYAVFPFYSWRQFQQDLLASFSDTNRHATARLEIDNVKQGSDTIDGYNIQFTTAAILTGYDELALIEKYKRGLKEAILLKIYALDMMPSTILGWKQHASLFDRQYRELQQYHHPKQASSLSSSKSKPRSTGTISLTSTASKPSHPTSSSTSTTTHFTPTPQTSTTPAPTPRPVKQEAVDPVLAEQRKQAGLCILCGEADHWANECPKRTCKQFKGKGRDRGSGKAIRTMDKSSQDTSHSKTTTSSTSMDTSSDISSAVMNKLSKGKKQALVMWLIKDGI